MSLLLRLDIDRAYGKAPFHRHVMSRISSDYYMPTVKAFGYLKELKVMLEMLNARRARSYVFFRKCTLPSREIMALIKKGAHEIGLHLEDSRSFETFAAEKRRLERHIGGKVTSFSKHGSRGIKYGYHHYAPYEPEKYVSWARQAEMRAFLGNLEDPSLPPVNQLPSLSVFPAAFWLEPAWRDTGKFTIDWLKSHALVQDTVLLIHPENVLENPELTRSLLDLVSALGTKILL
jgi:hypothetical protein